jgi:hypothetical protein
MSEAAETIKISYRDGAYHVYLGMKGSGDGITVEAALGNALMNASRSGGYIDLNLRLEYDQSAVDAIRAESQKE